MRDDYIDSAKVFSCVGASTQLHDDTAGESSIMMPRGLESTFYGVCLLIGLGNR